MNKKEMDENSHYLVAVEMSLATLEMAFLRERAKSEDSGKWGNKFHAYQRALREKQGVEMAASEHYAQEFRNPGFCL